MSRNTYVLPTILVEKLRREAKKLSKQAGIPYHQALDRVARDDKLGIRDWHHLIEEANASFLSEDAFKRGLVIGIDPKDADFNLSRLKGLVHDDRVVMFLRSDFEGRHPRPWSEDNEYEWEYLEELVYFRQKDSVPKTLEEALDLCKEDFFSPPQYVRLRGKEIDLYPEEEEGDDF